MKFMAGKLEDISAILDLQAANFLGNVQDTERQYCFLSVTFNQYSLRLHVDGLGMAHVGEFAFSG